MAFFRPFWGCFCACCDVFQGDRGLLKGGGCRKNLENFLLMRILKHNFLSKNPPKRKKFTQKRQQPKKRGCGDEVEKKRDGKNLDIQKVGKRGKSHSRNKGESVKFCPCCLSPKSTFYRKKPFPDHLPKNFFPYSPRAFRTFFKNTIDIYFRMV